MNVTNDGFKDRQLHNEGYLWNRKPMLPRTGFRINAWTEGLSMYSVPYVEWLGQKKNPQRKGWAAGADYGKKICTILLKIIDMVGDEAKEEPKEILYHVRKSFRASGEMLQNGNRV